MEKRMCEVRGKIIKVIQVYILVCLGAFLCWPTQSHAEDRKEAIAQTLLLMDWAQTRDIVRHQATCGATDGASAVDRARHCGEGYYETNPIIGEQPSMGRVNAYFATVMLGHYLIDRHLSPSNQDRFEWATIVLEAAVVLHNHQIGLSIKF